jgi:hypothetical protein
MTTKCTTQMIFDDSTATVFPSGDMITLRDVEGNAVTLSVHAILRCLSIAEKEKTVPAINDEFWISVRQKFGK